MSDIMDSDIDDEIHSSEKTGSIGKSEEKSNEIQVKHIDTKVSSVNSFTLPGLSDKQLDIFINDDEMAYKEGEVGSLELSMKKTKSNVIK
mmetsp:Transcript_32991/g.37853  ORF Transcript_32991/g.37853 Transcript_32991/m.37853 type:complete len:90 (-) Transcript_32991:409-678(-)